MIPPLRPVSSNTTISSNFETILEAWRGAPSPEGAKARQTAARKIQDCYTRRGESLDLSNLSLTSLPEVFTDLARLQKLNLYNNQLSTLPQGILALSSLQELRLHNNRLTALPEGIASLSSLHQLYLSNNQLSTLPEGITSLSSLRQLYLSNNRLTALPQGTASLRSLYILDLYKNELLTLPEGIASLSSLVELNLSRNRLSTLPQGITTLSSLQMLALSDNELTTLPEGIAALRSLYTLDLSDNRLSTLPEEIASLSSLQALLLSGNQLRTLPAWLAQWPSTRRLYAENNQLSPVAVQAFLDAIARARLEDPRRGPEFTYTIYDISPERGTPPLDRVLQFSWQKFQNTFPRLQHPSYWTTLEETTRDALPPCYQFFLNHPGQDDLRSFLTRLQNTKDFLSPRTQGNMILRVHRMLVGAHTNEQFRAIMYTLIHDALTSCHDRIAEAFDGIELAWTALCHSESMTDHEVIKFIIGQKRRVLLDTIAAKTIQDRRLGACH